MTDPIEKWREAIHEAHQKDVTAAEVALIKSLILWDGKGVGGIQMTRQEVDTLLKQLEDK